jgi:hypothetical protein
MQCTECGGPLVSLLERSRRIRAACYLLHRTRAEQHPSIGRAERPWHRPDETRGCGSPDEERR